jgi:cytochrome oxidase Cu insertion factor (SCO1/SenC/PrrC family)
VEKTAKQTRAGRWKLFMVLAVCASPMIFSYFTYYVVKPEGRTNYGTILDPREFPMPVLDGVNQLGETQELSALKGKWLLVQADLGSCLEACQKKLFEQRQLRTMQGKAMDRIERVWLVLDQTPIDPKILPGIDGTKILRVNPESLKKWLPVDKELNTQVTEHMYLIDPLGNLMMRFPKNADPSKVKKDLSKLLKASAIG